MDRGKAKATTALLMVIAIVAPITKIKDTVREYARLQMVLLNQVCGKITN